jgi:hypothetical protein
MTKSTKAAMLLTVAMFVAPQAIAGTCDTSSTASVEVDVQEAPITLVHDLKLADLRALSARIGRPPAHAVLGYYAGTVGYTVRSIELQNTRAPDGQMCIGLRFDAALIAVDRRIAVANDLEGSPCRVRAVIDHYRHHAAAASLALQSFASKLPAELEAEIKQHIRSRPGAPEELRQFIDGLLDGAVERFTTSLAEVQQGVDTESEIRRLSTPCDQT